MKPFENLDTALAYIKGKKPVPDDLPVADGDGALVPSPTPEVLQGLKYARSRLEYRQMQMARDSEDEQIAILQQNSIITEAFQKDGHSWWRDSGGNYMPIPRYDLPEQLVGAIEQWEELVLQKLEEGDRMIPDAEALYVFLRVSPQTIKAWRRGEMGEAFREIIEIELNKIAAVQNQLAMKGATPQVVWATKMNNVHNYTQAKNVEIDITAKRQPESVEALINSSKLLP